MSPIICVTHDALWLWPNRKLPALRGGIVALLHQAARSFDRQGLVLVDDVDRLGLPPKLPSRPTPHPVLLDAQDHGWHGTPQLRSAWLNLTRHDQSVHICVLPWLEGPDDMIDPGDILASLHRLYKWHSVAGGVWQVNGGVTGIGLLRDVYPPKYRGAPLWLPRNWEKIPPAAKDVQCEMPLNWQPVKPPPGQYRHGLDANRARLQFFGSVKVATGQLEHRNRLTWPRDFGHRSPTGPDYIIDQAGYVRISREAWAIPDFPHPAGDRTENARGVIQTDDGPRVWEWVTVPTLQLLMEVAEQGYIAPPTIYEGWLSPARQVWRRWADQLEVVWQTVPDLRPAVKETYRRTSGTLRRGSPRLNRQDWGDALLAEERCRLWRKWWAAYQAGHPPALIQTDAVWYNSDFPDPMFSRSAALPVHAGLGGFHPLGTMILDDAGDPFRDDAGEPIVITEEWLDLAQVEATTGDAGESLSALIMAQRALRMRP